MEAWRSQSNQLDRRNYLFRLAPRELLRLSNFRSIVVCLYRAQIFTSLPYLMRGAPLDYRISTQRQWWSVHRHPQLLDIRLLQAGVTGQSGPVVERASATDASELRPAQDTRSFTQQPSLFTNLFPPVVYLTPVDSFLPSVL